FIESDWFAHLSQEKKFHAIVSNPPYVAENDPELSEKVRRYEPESALMVGEDGLAALKMIIENAADFLTPQGFLFLEHGYNQGRLVADLMRAQGYQGVKTIKDLAGKDRVSLGFIRRFLA